jgi:hypothetical protein
MAGIKAGILTDAAKSALAVQSDLFANVPRDHGRDGQNK